MTTEAAETVWMRRAPGAIEQMPWETPGWAEWRRLLALTASCMLLAACGGGGSGSGAAFFSAAASTGNASVVATTGTTSASADTPAPADPAPVSGPPAGTPSAGPALASHTIGGTLSGLPPFATLILLDNGGDVLTLTADGAFRFAAPVAFTAAHAVSVGRQPNWANCTVGNGSGTASTDVTGVSVSCAPVGASVTTLAGSGAAGQDDGVGSAATFFAPFHVAVDAAGNVYVADSANNAVRKVTPDGVVSTLAGGPTAGSADGTGMQASFNGPEGVAVDAAGNVFVADSANNAIRKITPAGVVTTVAGSGQDAYADGPGTAASFSFPIGIAVDAAGQLYVADAGNQLIRRISPAGVVSTLAGIAGTAGAADGSAATASFNDPVAVALDTAGNLYVAEDRNHDIRKITPAGVVSTLAGSAPNPGLGDGTGTAALFNRPGAVAVDASGNLYVADTDNQAIRRITPSGVVTTLAGGRTAGYADGVGSLASFSFPSGIAVDADGNLYVGDQGNNEIRKIVPDRP